VCRGLVSGGRARPWAVKSGVPLGDRAGRRARRTLSDASDPFGPDHERDGRLGPDVEAGYLLRQGWDEIGAIIIRQDADWRAFQYGRFEESAN
jgi:hypothetical protein